MLRHRETAAPGVGRVVHVSRKPPSQCTITLTPRHGKIALALLILGAVAYLVVSRSRLVWPRQYGVSELKKEYPTTPTVALLAVPEYNASGAPFFTRLSTSISWGAAAIEPSTAVGIPYIIHRPQEGEFLRIMNLIWAAAGASTHVQSTVLEPPYTDERLLSTLLVAGHQAYGHGADYITIVKEAYWDVGFAMIPSIPSSVPQEQVRLGFLSDADGPYYLALHRNDWLEFADLLTQAPPSHWKELIIARYLVRSAARDLANRLSSPYMHFLSTEAFWRNLRTPDTTSAQQFAEFSSKALTLGSERSHTSFFIVMYCSSEDQLFSIAVAAEQWASLGLKLYILTTPGTSCDRHGKDVPAPAVHLPVDIGFSTHFLINHLLDQGGIMAEEVDTLLSLAFVPLLVQGGKLSPQDNVLVVDAATVVSMGEFVPLEVLALDPARRWKVFNVRSSSTPCVGWPLLATAQEWSALVGELFPGALQSVLKDVLQSLQSSPVDATFRFRDKVVIHLIWPYSQSALCQVVTYPLSKSEEAAEQAGADDAGAAPTTKVSLCTAMLDRDPLEAGNAANSALFKYLGQSLSGAATDKAIELSVYAAVDAGPYGVAKRSLEAAAQEWYTLTQGSIPLRYGNACWLTCTPPPRT